MQRDEFSRSRAKEGECYSEDSSIISAKHNNETRKGESEVEEDSFLFYTDLRSRGTRKSDKRVDSSSEEGNTKRGMEIEHEG